MVWARVVERMLTFQTVDHLTHQCIYSHFHHIAIQNIAIFTILLSTVRISRWSLSPNSIQLWFLGLAAVGWPMTTTDSHNYKVPKVITATGHGSCGWITRLGYSVWCWLLNGSLVEPGSSGNLTSSFGRRIRCCEEASSVKSAWSRHSRHDGIDAVGS